jgi:hypothetical protein
MSEIKNYISQVTEYYQKTYKILPDFQYEEDNNKNFICSIKFDNFILHGLPKKTKKDAKYNLCEKIIKYYIIIDDLNENNKSSIIKEKFNSWKNINYYKLLEFLNLKDNDTNRYYLTCAFLHDTIQIENELKLFLNVDSYLKYSTFCTLGDKRIAHLQSKYLLLNSLKNSYEIDQRKNITNKRQKMESNENFVKKMKLIGFDQYIIHNLQNDSPKIISDILEALIGVLDLLYNEEYINNIMKKLDLFN